MAGFNNREQFLASEPEMDMMNWICDMRISRKTRFWISYIRMREMGRIRSLSCSTAAHLPWGIKGRIISNQCVSL